MSESGRPSGDPSAPEPRVSIIVVSYNTREMTLECLRSVVRETRAPYELIVIDNASTDGSAEAIAAEFPEVALTASTENHGFAKANNIAARDAKADLILLLNPDTVILDGAIDKLLAFSQAAPAAGIWGGRTLYGDRSLNATSCFQRMTLWSVFCTAAGLNYLFPRSHVFNSESYGDWQRDDERPVDIVTGCFFLIRRPLWERLGGFDLTYVMYGEETDLCLRAAEAGAAPRHTPEATIIHYGGASEKVKSDKVVRLLRAKTTLYRRHFQGWRRPIALGLLRLWPYSRYLAFTGVKALRALFGKAMARDRSGLWAEVWSRRAEWRDGYPEISGAA